MMNLIPFVAFALFLRCTDANLKKQTPIQRHQTQYIIFNLEEWLPDASQLVPYNPKAENKDLAQPNLKKAKTITSKNKQKNNVLLAMLQNQPDTPPIFNLPDNSTKSVVTKDSQSKKNHFTKQAGLMTDAGVNMPLYEPPDDHLTRPYISTSEQSASSPWRRGGDPSSGHHSRNSSKETLTDSLKDAPNEGIPVTLQSASPVAIPFGKSLQGKKSSKKDADNHQRPPKALYSRWSKWSRCSKRCQQTRRRKCKEPSICGSAVIKERRSCVGWRCVHKRARQTQQNKTSNNKKKVLQPDVRLLPNYNSVFFSRWSDWRQCSRKCLTHRMRTCRYPLFCGTSVIKEEAYCYVPQTACEKWYKRHNLGPNTRRIIEKNTVPKDTWNLSKNRFIFNQKSKSSQLTNEVTQGVPDILSQLNGKNSKQKNVFSWTSKNQFKIPRKNTQDNLGNYSFSSNNPHRLGLSGVEDLSIANLDSPSSKKPKPHKVQGVPTSLGALDKENGLPSECGVSHVPLKNWSLRIIGGREAIRGKWPWQVAILNRFKEVFCGGTLVAPQWVITAAHCLRRRLYVRLGEHDLAAKEGQELDFRIYETVTHPLYDATTVDNDVALLRLPEPVEINPTIAPACVPDQGSSLPLKDACTIIGWGKARHSHFFGTDVLHEAKVPVIPEELCKKVYNDYYITQNMFCAGFRRGRIDSCAGDSGGPLLCSQNNKWYIYGITSFGEGCGRKGKYGIYAKVSNYRNWINDVISAHSHRTSSNFRRSALDNISPYQHKRRHFQWKRTPRIKKSFN